MAFTFFIVFVPKNLPHHHHSLEVIPIHILLHVPIFVIVKHHMLVPLPDFAIRVKLLVIQNAHVVFANRYRLSRVRLQRVELPSCDCLDNLPLDCSFFFKYLSSVFAIGSFLGSEFWGLRGKEIGVEA